MWTAFMFYSSLHYLFTFRTCPPHFCSITLASNIQWMYKISQRENIQGISNDSWRKNIRGKKSDICCIIHPKIRGGLWGYRRQHHDTKWNIYSRRDHLIQSNMYIYKGNEPDYPCTLHHSPWPFSCPCLPLFWLKMGTQLVLDHKNILYTAFVIALGSLFKWKNGILGIY